MQNSLQQIEGLLFVAGDEGVTLAELAAATNFLKPAVSGLLDELSIKYAEDKSSAFEILVTDDHYQLVTKSALSKTIHRYLIAPLTTALSQASLEVLAIIAYKQPVTRIEVDEIRGVQSQSTIQKLLLRDLVTSKGRANEPGRPILYGTTAYFLNYFGLTNIDQLPPLVTAEALESLKNQQDVVVPLIPAGNKQSLFDVTIADLTKESENNEEK
ncbi:SMC-Scp complex subunit ScpB [Weissella hellenica]|uniref:Segregation and condensation protein B n=1 Tax=Weissella hellenica TaxID=46256 RepID=A0A4Y4G3K7_WEIHE|nr:SMC-Scp complex subunit ScpB [Weissella hellenica]NKY67362.1 SMC-Scp complex subunit ScpB [Weissella hellenica]GED36397.1 segregation and condensation protein B [Weissella hellenica]SCC04284.1 segregation and condensation protein B [Weissella hellenica]